MPQKPYTVATVQRDPGLILDALAVTLAPVAPWRLSTSVPVLHPEVYVRNMRWQRGQPVLVTVLPHGLIDTPRFKDSPVARIYEGHGAMRYRLAGPDADLRYPVCAELATLGGTDYVIMPVPLSDGRLAYLSVTSDAAGGFSDADLAMIHAAVPGFGQAIEIEYLHVALGSLLEVYLGRNAAARVLGGAFKRGTGEAMQAVIWTCDLRGFTSLTESRPAADMNRLLNLYFDAVGRPIEANGGEILKFIGDAVLAVFPLGEDPTDAAIRALRAAEQAVDALAAASAALVATGGPALELGVALHAGEVFYGNIGTERRLDFTVIGPAVNEAARVEPLCKTLGTPLLMTDVVRDLLGDAAPALASMGAHALRGASAPRTLFTLPRWVR